MAEQGANSLPSETTEDEYIYLPSDKEDFEEVTNRIGGKWMVYNSGDLEQQDKFWRALLPLYHQGLILGLKATAAKITTAQLVNDTGDRIIICYTEDSDDKRYVKNTADAIRAAIGSRDIMYYKTNAASIEEEASSSKINENHQELEKEIQTLSSKLASISSDTSASKATNFFKRKMMDYEGSSTDASQIRTRHENKPARRNLSRQYQRVRGKWSFRCDIEERNSDGMTEFDIIWTAMNELHAKEADTFTLRPEKFFSRKGYGNINIYTPDSNDEEFILKTVNIIRRHISFPYVLYYYQNVSKYMHTPNGEFYRKNDDKNWELIE